MRASLLVVLALVAGTSLASCDSSPTAPTDPVVLILAPGDVDAAGDLVVKFVRVTSDTRCPADALCIQAGDAHVAIVTTLFGMRQEAELHLATPTKRSIVHGDYTVTLEELNPYPFLSRPPIAPGDYRARFRITGK